MPQYSSVGRPIPRIDAIDKVTGEALFAADINLPEMLHAKILRSDYPHARILNIDTTNAENLPGVKAIITAADVPNDETILARHKVCYVGHKIAAVAANNIHTAQEAINLIKVEYDELPAVFDAVEAMKSTAPSIHGRRGGLEQINNLCSHINIGHGDVEGGFKEADYVFEDTFTLPLAHQGYIEPHAVVASVDLNGKVTLWTSTQGHFSVRLALARKLGMPLNKIRVIPTEIGGGFGGKLTLTIEPICVLLAQKTRKPVKMVMTREEEFIDSHPGPGCIIKIKSGVKKDGTFTAMQAEVIWDTGAFPGAPIGFFPRCQGLYKIPSVEIDIYSVYTNKLTPGAYRAPGATQVSFAFESQMDIIAAELGIDPLELRMKNAVEEGDIGVDGKPYPPIALKECIQKAADFVGWQVRSTRADRSSGGNRQTKKSAYGRGIACGKWINGVGASSASVTLNEDGSIKVLTGAVDLTGVNTSFAQIAAEELGVPVEKVTVVTGDTDIAPYAGPSGGSRIMFAMGNAVKKAAADVKRQLFEMTAEILDVKPEQLDLSDGRIYMKDIPERGVTITALGLGSISSTRGPVLGSGSLSRETWLTNDPVFIVQIAEVEVDTETGEVKVINLIAAQDVGFAINPMSVEGQIEGAAVQGIGRCLMEEYIFDKGKMLNPSFWDYWIPCALDVPKIIPIIVELNAPDGPFGAKGAGEPAMIPAAAAIANAIYDAVGVRIKELPITAEKILANTF